MSSSEEDSYSMIFASLKHPIRRKILRILSSGPQAFSDLQKEFNIESSHLTYHIDDLRSLLFKTEDGKYALSSLGKAAVSMMKNVEEPSTTLNLPLPRQLGVVKIDRRTTAIALGVICIVLAASLLGEFAYYSPLVSEKNDTISSLNTLITEKNDTISSLNALVSQLTTNITNLQNQLANRQYSYPVVLSLNSDYTNLVGFEAFSHYDINNSSTPANNYSLGKLADWSETYAVTQGNYTIFHITLTSHDPVGRVMWVYLPSALYGAGSPLGHRFNFWKLVNVTGDPTTGLELNPTYAVSYALLPGIPMDVYFAGTGLDGGVIAPGNYPLNMMIYGKLGTADYGQNVPFVQLYFN